MSVTFCYITCSNVEEAKKIGRKLVEEKLAACINIFPNITSIYWWKGKIEEANETILIVKTKKELKDRVIKEVRKIHSYTLPCIVFFEIKDGLKEFLEWIRQETC